MAGRSKSKRSKQKILNAFEIAERQENGSGSENEYNSENDNELNVQDGILDASKFLKDGQNKEFDDDEIDSDEALGSDDDYDVLNSRFSQTIRDKAKKQKSKDKRRRKGEDVSEDEEDDEEGYSSIDESQLVGLSEAWDLDDKDLKKTKASGKDQEVVLDDAWDSESQADSESESESESDEDDEIEEDEDENEEDIFGGFSDDDVELSTTVSNLKSLLKKVPKEKRKLITETINENEFNIPSNGNVLSLTDMMAGVEGADASDAVLLDKDDKSKALDTPLPRNIQKKHERRAAYEITKEEVSKWEDTIQQNRQAEVLKFPLNPVVKHNDTATTFRSDNVPTTDLEKKIHNVLTESALVDDKKEATFEDLAVAKMSSEELKKRTNELRLMRELMFREETRARRIKKIKSKSFRKIKKKERLREQSLVEGSDLDESDIEENERKRAEERMSLKHKTQSKWAKSMIKSGLSKDASNREELEEMLRQGEKLRAKQLGYNEGDQSDDDASEIEREYNDNENSSDEDDVKSKLGKGVLAMDFMKAAEKRQKQANLQELEQLKKMERGEDIQDFTEEANSVSSVLNQGRRIYTPSAAAIKDQVNDINKKIVQEIKDDESSSLLNKLSKKQGKKEEETKDEHEISETSNPWLLAESNKKSSKVKVVDKDSSKQDKALNKMKKKSKSNSLGVDLDMEVGETLGLDIQEDDDEVFMQQDLIKEAFAGDNVTVEFEREKKRVIKDEDDKEEDMTLPGWGDWAGGNKKSKKRKIVRKVDGVVQKDKRRDKNLKNVIINEKVNKKNLKYQSSDVPFPYESREQYERALRMPVGQEWTSRETHQRLTMPRVITKQGTVIDPLKAPFK